MRADGINHRNDNFDNDVGTQGTAPVGFYFRGPNNYFRDNVATNLISSQGSNDAAYGIKYIPVYLGDIRVPNFKGADTSVASQYHLEKANGIPILEFQNNEVYSAESGLTYWWINTVDHAVQNGPPSTILNYRVWHHFSHGAYNYPAHKMIFDSMVVRGNPAVGVGDGFQGGDYLMKDYIFRNLDIRGMNVGLGELPQFRWWIDRD